jgi:hypothetical protein
MLRVVGVTLTGLALGAIWATLELRVGAKASANLAVGTLRAWYFERSGKAGPAFECRSDLLDQVPSPDRYFVDGSYPVFPLGQYRVIIYIGSGGDWYVVEFVMQRGTLINCYFGKAGTLRSSIRQRALKW